MKRKYIKIFVCLVLVTLLWNLIIGTFIYKIPYVSQQSDIGKHYAPFGKLTMGTEGFGQYGMDRYGFNNDDSLLAGYRDLILVLGDSHTEALQLNRSKNFCNIASNELISKKICLYNAGISGNSMAEYIYYGVSYINEFNPSTVIIQVTDSDFMGDALDPTKNCYIFEEDNSFKIIHNNNNATKLKIAKDKFVAFSPFTALLYNKVKTIFPSIFSPARRPFLPSDHTELEDDSVQNPNTKALIDWEIENVKKIYGNMNKFAFLYLPYTPSIDSNGRIQLEEADKSMKNMVKAACDKYKIDFIDMEPEFIKLLKTESKFPRGFNNTSPGSGHLNGYGHYVTGKKLAKYLNNN